MSQPDDPGPGSTPYGSTPHGSPPHSSQPYGYPPPPRTAGGERQGQPAAGEPAHGQSQYGQPQYGQPAYGQSPYGQPTYGQSPYGQPAYGQPPYGGQYGQPGYGAPAGYGQHGWSAAPSRPGQVLLAAVLGFVFGAFGVLATLGVFLGGAAVVGLAGALETGDDPLAGLGGDAAAGVGLAVIAVGVICLAWTVLMIWGAVWALTGRSRVLLLVGGSIAAVVTFLGVLSALFDTTTGTGSEYAFGILLSLVFFLASLAIVVPLSRRPATQFFAAHRAGRGR